MVKTITLSGDQLKAVKAALTLLISSVVINVGNDMPDCARQAIEQVGAAIMETFTLSGDQLRAVATALTLLVAVIESDLAVLPSKSTIMTLVSNDMLDCARQALEQVEAQS